MSAPFPKSYPQPSAEWVTHNNLQLVRQLFERFLDDLLVIHSGNKKIVDLVDDGDDCVLVCLLGTSVDLVASSLRRLLQLASEPAPDLAAGRYRKRKQELAQTQRDDIAFYARVALALIERESPPKAASASPEPTHQPKALPVPLPESAQELMRTMAIQLVTGSGSTKRSRPLWSRPFHPIGQGDSLMVKLRPDLTLEISNSSSGQVLMQTEPVDFGPLAQNSKTVEEKFESWCQMRNRDLAAPYLAPGDEKPSAKGNEA